MGIEGKAAALMRWAPFGFRRTRGPDLPTDCISLTRENEVPTARSHQTWLLIAVYSVASCKASPTRASELLKAGKTEPVAVSQCQTPRSERMYIYKDADSELNNGEWSNWMPKEAASMM